ncbi:MAG: RNA chaperone Hfq [Defluviitaleaceae bacterium]|nr:RNA chaperone Hfq [Defluviitaleaceae bacterium]
MAMDYQDRLLNAVQNGNIQVTIYLTSGFQIRGQIRGFDAYVLIVESDGKQQMVYKHAISTVVPVKPIGDLGDAQ